MMGLEHRLSRRAVCFALPTLACLCLAARASAADRATRELVLEERFGISHPSQIVYFDPAGTTPARRTVLVDGKGRQVPYQVMADGRLAVRTDLPPGARRRWTLRAGTPKSQGAGVRTRERDTYYEITNEMIGVRVPNPPTDLSRTPSPIQGLRYQDGTWTATGPNWMDRPARSMSVRFLERGPLVVRVELRYVFDRAELRAQFEKGVIPAGEGPYTSTIELQAGQPSVLIEEYSEVDIGYAMEVTHGLEPNRAQYRGHHSTSVADGRDSKGHHYGAKRTGAGVVFVGSRGREDALVDLDLVGRYLDRWSMSRYPFMAHWDTWAVNTGYYWQLYATDRDGDNLLGIFSRRPSRLIGPGLTGVSIDARPDGVTDLDSAVDASGHLHAVYQRGRALWYVRFGPDLAPTQPGLVGGRLAHPSLAVGPSGEVSIAALDTRQQAVVLCDRAANGAWQRRSFTVAGDASVQLDAPEPLHVRSGQRRFVFVVGRYGKHSGGLLFAKTPEQARYELLETVPADPSPRLRSKPAMVVQPNGDVLLAYTDKHYWFWLARLARGAAKLDNWCACSRTWAGPSIRPPATPTRLCRRASSTDARLTDEARLWT